MPNLGSIGSTVCHRPCGDSISHHLPSTLSAWKTHTPRKKINAKYKKWHPSSLRASLGRHQKAAMKPPAGTQGGDPPGLHQVRPKELLDILRNVLHLLAAPPAPGIASVLAEEPEHLQGDVTATPSMSHVLTRL